MAVTTGHEGYTILKYSVDQKFNLHVDDHPDFTRRVSMVYYPNDDYEGGEITFNNFDITYKPKSNELIIFPSNFMYSHSVSPVTSGTRYAVVTWIN
jgi:predicted 2-oxoglutarate/Fe(II)-dependent dioxygenase YbiX